MLNGLLKVDIPFNNGLKYHCSYAVKCTHILCTHLVYFGGLVTYTALSLYYVLCEYLSIAHVCIHSYMITAYNSQ